VLQAIAVTPANPSIAKGLAQQFTATGTFSDGSTSNLTATVTWASATTAVATINASGLATAVAAGTSTISATLSGITGSTTLTVTSGMVTPTVVSYSVLFGSSSFNLIGATRNRLPWQIIGIRVVFSEAITAGSAASLSGITATGLFGLGTNTLTWTFDPISIGSFLTMLAGNGPNALKDAAGNALGGGAGFTQNVKLLWGDVNDDGMVNAQDLALVNAVRSQPYNIFDDLNGDGVVDLADVQIVRANNGNIQP